MFAFVSNEYSAVVYSRQQLDIMLKRYSFPVFSYCETLEECYKFLREKARPQSYNQDKIKAGWKQSTAYIRVDYIADGECLYINAHTENFGPVYFDNLPSNVLTTHTYDLVKIKVTGYPMDTNKISNHVCAVLYIINLFGPYLNLEILVPDISVYLGVVTDMLNNPATTRGLIEANGRPGKVSIVLR